MKKYLSTLILLLTLNICFSQTETTKEEQFKLPENRVVELNLKFATNILVKTWDKQEIGLVSKTLSDSEEIRKIPTQKVESEPDRLYIETDYDKKLLKKRDFICMDCENQIPDQKCHCLRVNYEVFVPKNAKLSIETIAGNIEIKAATEALQAKSISGFVDLSLDANRASDLQFKSVTGEIYTDFDIDLEKGSSAYSKKVKTSINGGGTLIQLESISGNIFLRRI